MYLINQLVRNERESTTHTTQTTLEDEAPTHDLAITTSSAKLGLIIPNENALEALEESPKLKCMQAVEAFEKEEVNLGHVVKIFSVILRR